MNDRKIFPKKIRTIRSYFGEFIRQIEDPVFLNGLKRLKSILEKAPFVFISTHENPDADGVGSEIALALGLNSLGIPSRIINPGKIPDRYTFLDEKKLVSKSHLKTKWDNMDESILLLVDSNDFKRTGWIYNNYHANLKRIFFIDHHKSKKALISNHLISTNSSSTGEIVFLILKYFGCGITKEIARAIYAAILFDTGSFRYSHTGPLTHKIVAELLELNIQPINIHESIFENYRINRVSLLGKIIQKIEFQHHNQLAILNIKYKDIIDTNSIVEDTDDLVNTPLQYKGVAISALFRQRKDGIIKVSLRSVGNLDVASIVNKFGGGGHRNAAGATLNTETEKKRMIEIIKKVLP